MHGVAKCGDSLWTSSTVVKVKEVGIARGPYGLTTRLDAVTVGPLPPAGDWRRPRRPEAGWPGEGSAVAEAVAGGASFRKCSHFHPRRIPSLTSGPILPQMQRVSDYCGGEQRWCIFGSAFDGLKRLEEIVQRLTKFSPRMCSYFHARKILRWLEISSGPAGMTC